MPFTPDSPAQQPESQAATPGFVPDQTASEAAHSTPSQTALTALESSIPGAKAFESAEPATLTPILNRLGPIGRVAGIAKELIGKVNPEDIRAREEANPVASTVGNIAGLLVPGGEGALLERAGSKVLQSAETLAPSLVGKGILKGMSRGAIKLAAENALYQGGDEITKTILNDPNQTVGSAISNIGLAAGLGAIAGGTLGSVNPLWKAASETKMGELVSDFKTRMQEHLGVEPDMVPKTAPKDISMVSETTSKAGIDPFTKEQIQVKPSESIAPESLYKSYDLKYDPFTKTEAPILPKPMASISAAETSGGKLADMLVKNSDNIMSKGLAGAVGGAIGHMTGIPLGGAAGALIGERVLGPALKSILPAIGKAVLEKEVNPAGFKAALDYSMNALKGEKLTNAAIKNTFTPISNVLPEGKQPTIEMRKKLDAALEQYQQDPTKLANIGSNIGHYMPQHATAIGMIANNAVNFLNSIRPQSIQRAPLDPPLKPSQAIQAQYDKVLDIAQQPLTVLQNIKDGTLTSHDVIALHTLYPELYSSMCTKMTTAMVETISKGETIPYETRLGMSMFLQQPLDSTMKPIAIALAQPSPQQPQEGSLSAQSSNKSPKKVSQAASSNLIKGAKSNQTASQASEAMHVNNKA